MTTFCNQNDKGRLLILKLGERVQDTVDILSYQQRQNYGMLRRQLMETYAAPPDSGLWYATLMNRKKLAAESVAAYVRDIQRLVGKLNIHPSQRDQYVRNAFLSGLSPDLQLYLGPSRTASLASYCKRLPTLSRSARGNMVGILTRYAKCFKLTFQHPDNTHFVPLETAIVVEKMDTTSATAPF